MKIYLERAAANYAKLVPTHPMEKEEFQDALKTCEELSDQYVGPLRGPCVAAETATAEFAQTNSGYTPTAEKELTAPGDPEKSGGLTRSEQLVSQDLVNFWNCLPQGGHSAAVATAVHNCQSALQARILRRDYPNYWMSTPGSLQQDARVESERWNTQ